MRMSYTAPADCRITWSRTGSPRAVSVNARNTSKLSSALPAGSGALEGSVQHVRTFGPIQRAEVALCGAADKTVIEIDAPRDRDLQPGDTVSLQPRRYRIFAAQE